MNDMPVTSKILSYIENNLDQELSVQKIAEQLNYSPFYIARAFKNHTDMTLHKYIQCRRLHEAAKKLAETKKPIAEIALEAGYSSQQAFTQAFRSTYFVTPLKYRKNGIFIPKQNRIFMGMRRMSVTVLMQRMGGKMAA